MERSPVRSGVDAGASSVTKTDAAPETLDIPSQILPGLIDSAPILPAWLTGRLQRLFARAFKHGA